MTDVFNENNIPGLDLNVEAIDSNASTLKTKASDLRTAGSSIKTTWSGMSACYKAPEQETLYAAMNPVETNTDDLADDLEKIAGYVNTFADEARRIKSEAQTLKNDGLAFKKKIAAKPDWQYDQELVTENTRLVNRASALQVRLWDAERECANDIRALDSLPPYHADPKGDNDQLAYGYSSIPQDAEKSWGKSVPRQDKCPKKAAVMAGRGVRTAWNLRVRAEYGFAVDGFWGDMSGLASLFSVETWKAAGGLIGLSEDENGVYDFHENKWSVAGSTWKEAAKEFSHWDMWGTDPARAFGVTAYDLGIFAIPYVGPYLGAASKVGKAGKFFNAVSKVGKATKVGKAAAAVGKVASVASAAETVFEAAGKAGLKIAGAAVVKSFPGTALARAVEKWMDLGHLGGNGDVPELDMDSPELPELTVGAGGKAPSIDMDASEVPDLSSKPQTSSGSSNSALPHEGAPQASNGDGAHMDTDVPRAARASESGAESGRSDAGHDGEPTSGRERVRQNDGDSVPADADGYREPAADGSEGSGRERAERDVDSGAEPDRERAARDADTESGRDRTDRDGDAAVDRGRARDADAGHADADGRRDAGGNDVEGPDAEDRGRAGRHAESDADARVDGRRADAGDARRDVDSGAEPDRERAARDADTESGRDRADRDGDVAVDRERARDADAGHAGADRYRDSARSDAEGPDGSDHGRAGRDGDAETGRDRADGDAAEGRGRQGGAETGRADTDSHRDPARSNAEGADGSGRGRSEWDARDADSDAESGRNKTDRDGDAAEGREHAHDADDAEPGRDKADGDGSGEHPNGERKEPLKVEERQAWVDQVDEGRDQDAFNQKHRTAGPEVKENHRLTLGSDEPFGVGRKLDVNAHYEVTRTTSDGVSYKTHYYTDASGEVRHVETSSRVMTGEYNPDLRNPYPNATYTVDGRFHYTTDKWARTVRLEVDHLKKVGDAYRWRSGYIQSKVNKYGSELGGRYSDKYEGGHIVGDQFGGAPEEINTVPMLEEVNQSRIGKESNSYLVLERDMAANPEDYSNIVLELQYPDPVDPSRLTNTERVPTKFEVTWVDSGGVPDRKGLENLPEEARGLGG